MPFRDAGRCEADYGLSIQVRMGLVCLLPRFRAALTPLAPGSARLQDCLYGMFKALELGLIDLSAFNPEEYCYYEQVQNGDFNWVSKNFIAFASPTDNAYVRAVNTNTVGAYERDRKRSKGYANVLRYFEESGVKLVVRLNNPLYDRRDFERRGIEFKDMFFEDGTNVRLPSLAAPPAQPLELTRLCISLARQPPKEMVREFLRDADRVIGADGVIAIHCKAGLGRTGCLIAAHLVYKYGFTAGEVIGFMRICRVRPSLHLLSLPPSRTVAPRDRLSPRLTCLLPVARALPARHGRRPSAAVHPPQPPRVGQVGRGRRGHRVVQGGARDRDGTHAQDRPAGDAAGGARPRQDRCGGRR